jgi:hypothetical protein
MSNSNACSHGVSMDRHCEACKKLYASLEKIGGLLTENAELRKRIAICESSEEDAQGYATRMKDALVKITKVTGPTFGTAAQEMLAIAQAALQEDAECKPESTT